MGFAASAQMPAQTAAPADVKAAAPHFPTSEELRHLKAVSSPLLSPDGQQVLFVVTESTADGGATHLWLAPAPGSAHSGDKARQITFSAPADKRGERAPQWAPDGQAIYFITHRGENTQLFRLDLRGGEASAYDLKVLPPVDESKLPGAIPPAGSEKAPEKTTATLPADEKKSAKKDDEKKAPEPLPLDIGGYAPSPDGKWLAIWARDPETPGEKKQKEAKADAEWVDHETHGTRLYLAALKPDGSVDGGLKAVALAPDVHQALWSPASDRLFAVTEEPNGASDLGPAGAAWIVTTAAPEKPVKLAQVPATVGRGAAWRRDGKELVFAAQTPDDAPPGYDELFALSPEGSAAPARMSPTFTGQMSGAGYYTADGSFVTDAALGTHLTVVRVTSPMAAPVLIDLGASVVDALNTNRRETGWLWLAQGAGEETKLCYAAKLGDACQGIATPELAPAGLEWVKPQLIQWRSGDLTIEGLLYLPPGASAGKVPLVVDVHGGPMGAFEDRNDPLAAFLVGHGWAILRPNPRGSSNYGTRFAAANKNDLGGGDYQDIMAGVDYVLSKFPLDANKMALMGYSYGGEMAGFVEGKTDRFKAIVSGAPVIDQYSEYGTEGDSWYDRWYFGKPWEREADAWRQSPLSGAAHARTPFLLIQGQDDTTDPLGQSEEMYRALRQEGVPVELVTYPRENHGPLAGGIFGRPSPEPWHGFDGRQRIVDFIEKYFGAASKP
jgi:dipeptidyl aminopeptidase/acylaminoacyl peptidase